jgi:hypothetical protein
MVISAEKHTPIQTRRSASFIAQLASFIAELGSFWVRFGFVFLALPLDIQDNLGLLTEKFPLMRLTPRESPRHASCLTVLNVRCQFILRLIR